MRFTNYSAVGLQTLLATKWVIFYYFLKKVDIYIILPF